MRRLRQHRVAVVAITALLLTATPVATDSATAAEAPMASAVTTGVPQRDCLPDGSGALRVEIRGAHDFDIDWGNARTTCHGAGSQYGVGVNFGRTIDAGATLTFGVTIQGLAEGATGSDLSARVAVSGDAVDNDLFSADCRVTVNTHELIEERGTRTYKVAGSGTCAEPARGYSGGELTISPFSFTGSTDWPG